MKKVFDAITITLGATASVAVVLFIVFVFLTSINESTGKSITGTTKTLKATVTGIACYEEIKDINFSLKDSDRRLYINRGLEKGLVCSVLRNKLIDKQVEISYVDSWLDPREGTHINRLTCNGEVIYSELK